jgi:hypothetical protein
LFGHARSVLRIRTTKGSGCCRSPECCGWSSSGWPSALAENFYRPLRSINTCTCGATASAFANARSRSVT